MRVALIDAGNHTTPFKACLGHYRAYLDYLGDESPGKVIYADGKCDGCRKEGRHPSEDETWPSRKENLTMTGARKLAHDSGDGATIYHCPFCGSGQVIARSDRSIECEYCHQCFTVQVQPQFPAFPQTINGMPMQVPGMPGAPGGLPQDPGADPMGGMGMPPGQDVPPMDGGAGPGDPMTPGEDEEPEDDGEEESDDAPPFAKGSMLRTASGARLAYDDYLRHLAIRHADNKDAVLDRVRSERTR